MKPVQKSMVAQLLLEEGGFRYWWYDGDRTRWSADKYRTRDQAVSSIKSEGFGQYRFEGKTISVS